MFIDQIFPQAVAAKDVLSSRFVIEAQAAGWCRNELNEVILTIPVSLLTARCFEDKLTGLWRYEFGRPFYLKATNELLWGTHMWVPISTLVAVLCCVRQRLTDKERRIYLNRLANPEKHPDVLAEMIPMLRVDTTIPAQFEVAGIGKGNKTVDWLIGPYRSRSVLLDVKRRMIDLIRGMERLGEGQIAPDPDHDPAVLFKSVEDKFEIADPSDRLQGVWVVTDIRQERFELLRAFDALDATKVHFAVLGDLKPDAHVLVRREADRQFLLNLFQANEGSRYTFERGYFPK